MYLPYDADYLPCTFGYVSYSQQTLSKILKALL